MSKYLYRYTGPGAVFVSPSTWNLVEGDTVESDKPVEHEHLKLVDPREAKFPKEIVNEPVAPEISESPVGDDTKEQELDV